MFEGISFTMWEVIIWVVITYIIGIAVGYGICYVRVQKLEELLAKSIADYVMGTANPEEEIKKIKESIARRKGNFDEL